VPSLLSDLCLRLLAKEPHARVQNAEALYEALEKLLEEAKADPRWEVPLCYGWTADGRTTEDAPELVGHDSQAWLRRWIRQKPKRGKPPPPPAEPPAQPAPPTARTIPPPRTRMGRLVPLLVAGVVVGLVVGVGHVLQPLRSPPSAPTPPSVPDPRVQTRLVPRMPMPLVPAERCP
jgi:eukaryotic-like serine/threonine-protein kinase